MCPKGYLEKKNVLYQKGDEITRFDGINRKMLRGEGYSKEGKIFFSTGGPPGGESYIEMSSTVLFNFWEKANSNLFRQLYPDL
jgi:hypothetical protein